MPKSDATVSADHAALLAERYGFPIIDGARARFIAALHALINWVIEHPDVPVPDSVQLAHHPVISGGQLTPTDLIDLARALDGEVDEREGSRWCRAELPLGDHGTRVRYVAFAGDYSRNDRPL